MELKNMQTFSGSSYKLIQFFHDKRQETVFSRNKNFYAILCLQIALSKECNFLKANLPQILLSSWKTLPSQRQFQNKIILVG